MKYGKGLLSPSGELGIGLVRSDWLDGSGGSSMSLEYCGSGWDSGPGG